MTTATLEEKRQSKEELASLLIEKEKRLKRYKCRTDLFYLLTEVLNRPDVDKPWLKARCIEVQNDPDGYLDLWARDHYKSTIITFGKTIQDILASHGNDPLPQWNGKEPVFGLFSHTRPIAKGFLRQIKREFETNERLKDLFPDILWKDPQKEAPKWSEDDGIIVKRKSNPKESTVEAWGLIDSQPTSKHFDVRVYDDVVTAESVSTPDMIAKTNNRLELSDNLGTENGVERYVGTRYHYNDTYKMLIDRGIKTRVYPCTDDGTITGNPVLLSADAIGEKRRKQGPYTFACQMLLNPKADEAQGFRSEWLKTYESHNQGEGMNAYILCDPANEKKKSNDYTVFMVVGLGTDNNYYILEITRDRLNLTERTKELFKLHEKWDPKGIGYEKYGMQSDIAHIKDAQERRNYRFDIQEVGGPMPKNDRIRRLIPLYEQGRVYMMVSEHKTNYEGNLQDLAQIFIHEEFKAFPVSEHDDMLDCLARITDPKLETDWPKKVKRNIDPTPPVIGDWMGV